jgi:DNA-binding response OmpR family regulator
MSKAVHPPPLARVLLVEDDASQRAPIRDYLNFIGYQTLEAADAEQALKLARDQLIDLIIADWLLPDLPGTELCGKVRQLGFKGPIALLTCKSDLESQVGGLTSGADDYLIKPVPLSLLKARVEALLRRYRHQELTEPKVRLGSVVFDREKSLLIGKDKTCQLGVKEAGILGLLVLAKDAPVNRDRILASVWRYDYLPKTRSVDNYVLSLRRKLEQCSRGSLRILTRRGHGYTLSIAEPG